MQCVAVGYALNFHFPRTPHTTLSNQGVLYIKLQFSEERYTDADFLYVQLRTQTSASFTVPLPPTHLQQLMSPV